MPSLLLALSLLAADPAPADAAPVAAVDASTGDRLTLVWSGGALAALGGVALVGGGAGAAVALATLEGEGGDYRSRNDAKYAGQAALVVAGGGAVVAAVGAGLLVWGFVAE